MPESLSNIFTIIQEYRVNSEKEMKKIVSLILCGAVFLSFTGFCPNKCEEKQQKDHKTVNLTLKKGTEISEALYRLSQMGVEVVSVNGRISSVTVKAPADCLVKAENLEFIESFYTPGFVQLPKTVSESLSGTSDVFQGEISDDGAGTVIAVIDSGFNPDHETMTLDEGVEVAFDREEMEDKIGLLGYGSYYNQKIPFYFNYADGNYIIKEEKNGSHGMHVAALAAGNSGTVASYAKNAQLFLMRVFGEGEDSTSDFLVAKAIVDAVDLGADVINLSLGSPGGITDNENCYSSAIEYARTKGVVVVSAAGNEGNANKSVDTGIDNGVMSTPGDLGYCLSVGALNQNSVASFSSFGPNSDLSFGNKLIAPGVSVLSADNEGYSQKSGTSFSSPITASAAALVLKRLKTAGYGGREAYDLTVAMLENAALPIDDFNTKQAAGVLNIQGALSNNVIALSDNGTGLIEFSEISKTASASITLLNISQKDITLSVHAGQEMAENADSRQNYAGTGLMLSKQTVTVPAFGSTVFDVRLNVGEDVPLGKYITGHIYFEGEQTEISCPYLGYYGDWDADPVISTRDDETGLALYSFDGEKYVKNSVISANGDGVNDYLFPFFFQLRSAEYVKVDIYTENMEFISNVAYLAFPAKDQYFDMYEQSDANPVDKKASLFGSGLGFDAFGYNPKTGEIYELLNGNYIAAVETKLYFEGAATERHLLHFSVTDYTDSASDEPLPEDRPEQPSFGNGDIEFSSFSETFTTLSGKSDGEEGEYITYTDFGKVNVDADSLEINGASVELGLNGLFEYDFYLKSGSYTPFRIIAKKDGKRVADRSLVILYDRQAPYFETDLEKKEVPDWLAQRLEGEFEGVVKLSDHDGIVSVSGRDARCTQVFLFIDEVYVQLGAGCSEFNKKFYCTTKQNGDIMTVGCSDAVGNISEKNYIFVSTEPILGDNDFDGSLTATDALRALEQAVGKTEHGVLSKALSDADGNRRVTATDALMILQAAVGKISIM